MIVLTSSPPKNRRRTRRNPPVKILVGVAPASSHGDRLTLARYHDGAKSSTRTAKIQRHAGVSSATIASVHREPLNSNGGVKLASSV